LKNHTQEESIIYDIVEVYTRIDDVIKNINHKQDRRQRMSDSEVITTAIWAHMHFAGNIEKARKMLKAPRYIPDMLSKSRLTRRLHALDELLNKLFSIFGIIVKYQNDSQEYIIDSFPVSVCHNIRISRCRLLQGEQYRGRCVAKREYFYGFKVHLITTEDGIPIEIGFLPGSANDSRAFDVLSFDLPEQSALYADSGYTDYNTEDSINDALEVEFSPCRKKNSMRGDELPTKLLKEIKRKMIETTFSVLHQLFPKKIHAVTIKGFLMKVFLFVLAFTLQQIKNKKIQLAT
jgi:hypothetical protein